MTQSIFSQFQMSFSRIICKWVLLGWLTIPIFMILKPKSSFYLLRFLGVTEAFFKIAPCFGNSSLLPIAHFKTKSQSFQRYGTILTIPTGSRVNPDYFPFPNRDFKARLSQENSSPFLPPCPKPRLLSLHLSEQTRVFHRESQPAERRQVSRRRNFQKFTTTTPPGRSFEQSSVVSHSTRHHLSQFWRFVIRT